MKMTVAEKSDSKVEQVDTSKTIVQLTANNVKRITAVRIRPDGNGLVIVGGNNGQGKTSVLDSIMYALGGGATIPDKPIREGSKTADIVLELKGQDGEELTVTRTFGVKGSQVTIENKSGASYKKPQAMLDSLVGPISFDIGAFARLAPRRKKEMLLEILGVDTDHLDGKRKDYYDQRTLVNRDTKALETRAAGMAFTETMQAADTHEIANAMTSAIEWNSKERGHADAVNRATDSIDLLTHECADIKDAQNDLDADIREFGKKEVACALEAVKLKEELVIHEGMLEGAKAECEAASKLKNEFQKKDISELKSQMETADAVNEQYRLTQAHLELLDEISDTELTSKQLTGSIEHVDNQKQELLQSVEYPIDGLAFTDDGLEFNNVPLEQASSAEQLKVAFALGIAMNPELRVLLIRDGSLFDDANLAALEVMATEANAQVWIERVGDGDERAFIIEDGENFVDHDIEEDVQG